jgi:hypothetical protein
MQRSVLLLCLLSVLLSLSACGRPSPQATQEALIGKWKLLLPDQLGPADLDQITEFTADGRYRVYYDVAQDDPRSRLEGRGKFTLDTDGRLTIVTQPPADLRNARPVTVVQMVQIDGDRLTLYASSDSQRVHGQSFERVR